MRQAGRGKMLRGPSPARRAASPFQSKADLAEVALVRSAKPPFPCAPRRGGIFIAILGVTMIIALIGLASLSAVRAQRLTVTMAADTDKARLYAESGVELGVQLIASDPNWRTSRTSGVWITSETLGDGAFSLSGTDPVDNVLANRPTDPVVLQATGFKGSAQQIVKVTLAAVATPIDALKMALHTAGQLNVSSGATLTVTGAPGSTNGTLQNNGAISGSAECTLSTGLGTVSGTLKLLAPAKAMPDAGIMALYTSLGTVISPPSTIDRVALGPGHNPWASGALNADGVYVINLSGDLTIRRSHICGTLVIVGASRTVTIDQYVFMHPARGDYPAIITDATLVLAFSGSSVLSESGEGTNFNPPGVPYLGSTNLTLTDSYPSEIQGLVHTRGKLTLDQSSRVRGAVLCESSLASGAVTVNSQPQIIYDPALWSTPPMGYAKSVTMSIVPGSWAPVVLP